jgi:cyclic pyranopterin phosphate synthase
MIDVGAKAPTDRTATAEAILTTRADVIALVRAGPLRKGDPLRVSEVAGIQGVKKTADLLPLCHPIGVNGVEVVSAIASDTTIRVTVTARTHDRTGVEMEALVGASTAALCVYDMLKHYDPAIVIGPIRLLEKTGGKSGRWVAGS